MPNLTVLYDSCVLYPAPLRDLLMRLALCGLFRARWSADIHEEWMRNVLKQRSDLCRKQLERTRRLMDSHVYDALVTGYQKLIPSLNLPDKNDRHVLAAAIAGHANIIVTFNLKHFPGKYLASYAIKPMHPDMFVKQMIKTDETLVCSTIKQHRSALRHPPKTIAEYLKTMENQGLIESVLHLRQLSKLL